MLDDGWIEKLRSSVNASMQCELSLSHLKIQNAWIKVVSTQNAKLQKVLKGGASGPVVQTHVGSIQWQVNLSYILGVILKLNANQKVVLLAAQWLHITASLLSKPLHRTMDENVQGK